MARFMETSSRMGVRFHTKPSKRWWLGQLRPWLGFEVGAKTMRVRPTPAKLGKGGLQCLRRATAPGGRNFSAKEAFQRVSLLNVMERFAPGGFCRLRSGWDVANRSGIVERRQGSRSADYCGASRTI